ncbi:MAG: aspartate/glutamate racemase family protein [Holophagaceae bacterium]
MSAPPTFPPRIRERLGWRARIGVITPAVGMAVTADFHRIAPEGVAMVLAAVPKPITEDSVEQLTNVGEGVVEAARRLLLPRADVALWNTSSGSFIKGPGYDQELIARIQEATGLRATTASTAMIEAFRALGVSRVCLATPYLDEINLIEKAFLEAHGVEVPAFRGLGILDVGELLDVPAATMADLARAVDVPEADAVFISNAGWSALEVLEGLEAELGKPVISTNQASLWAAFRLAGIHDRVAGHGRLLREA